MWLARYRRLGLLWLCEHEDFTSFSIPYQGIIPRVERLGTYAVYDTNPIPGSAFFVPLGHTVKFYCICQYVTIIMMIITITTITTSTNF